jgi:hypothetical protein
MAGAAVRPGLQLDGGQRDGQRVLTAVAVGATHRAGGWSGCMAEAWAVADELGWPRW